jgi:hypothetical protein
MNGQSTRLVLSWLLVVVLLGYGVFEAVKTAIQLFTD